MATASIAQVSLVATSCAVDEHSWDALVTNNLLSHQIRITDPFRADQEVDLKWYLEERATRDPFAESRATTVERNLELYAISLYEQLKPAFTRMSLDIAPKQIFLAISDRGSDRSIHRLHWEALEHPILRGNICVYRVQENTNVEAFANLAHKNTSLDLLFMTARIVDRSQREVDQRLILRPVLGFIAGISSAMPVRFDIVRPGTFEALDHLLCQCKGRYNLIHFDVHGGVTKGRAQLYFAAADDPSSANPVDAAKIGKLLQKAGIRVVVLNACNSAVSDSGMAANLALELLRCGVSTVIGMSYKLLTRAADIFMRRFYESLLVKGTDILTSNWEARRALQEERSRQAPFGLNVNIDDWIVPIFYTQHALVQNPSSDLGLDLGDLPKIPLAEWKSVKDSGNSQVKKILGREFDALLLENNLIKRNGFLHLYGHIGVGKTALLDDSVSWWLTTKYISGCVTVDISEFFNQPLTTILDRLRVKVKELSGTDQQGNPDTSSTKTGHNSKLPGSTNAHILILIDQAENYLRVLKEDSKSDFFRALHQFHADINQLYPTLMIIASCCKMKKPFDHMTLEPLQKEDALNLALQISPKALERVRKSDYERAFCYKLVQSLGGNPSAKFFRHNNCPWFQSWGNPLALKLVFAALERLLTKSLSEIVLSIWTEGFPSQIYEKSPGLERHVDYLLRQSEDELSKTMLTVLSPFKDRVPKNLSIYFDHLTVLKALPEPLLGSTESEVLDKTESSQTLERFHEMVKSIIIKLDRAGFVIDTDHHEQWILHPLLPYILSPMVSNFSTINREKVMKAHADSYMARAKEWKSNSPLPIEDMQQEYLNFIGSFQRLANSEGISIRTQRPSYLVNLLTSYDIGDESNNPDMVIALAMCEETLTRFQKSSREWERSLTSDLIYRPSGGISEVKMELEEHRKSNCPCQSLVALISIAFEVETYHSTRTNDQNALRVHLQRPVELWNLHEKHFDDDFHYQINCGAGGSALMQVGSSYLTLFCAPEALDSLTRAQKLLQDSLALYPIFKYHLEICKIYIARAEMLIANHGSRDHAILNFRQDELAELVDKMWHSGPETDRPPAWHDAEERQRQAKGDSSIIDAVSILAKDISNPYSQVETFRKLRQVQLDTLSFEMETNWIWGQIQSKNLMALSASRTHDWKQAQRLHEDILILLDQVKYDSEMERRLKKFEFHNFAAQAAFSGTAYAAAIQHLQKGYDILRSYELVHDTRYSMFKILSMANQIPTDVSYQLGGLTSSAQALQLLILLYDPTILESQDVRKLAKNLQDMIRTDFTRRMNGTLFDKFWNTYCWDKTLMNFRPSFPMAGQELLIATGANSVEYVNLVFGEYWKARSRIPAEVPIVADQAQAFALLSREVERAFFAPLELRKNFQWLDKKYEEHGLRRKWPQGYDKKAETEMRLDLMRWRFLSKLREAVSRKKNLKQSSIPLGEPATSSR